MPFFDWHLVTQIFNPTEYTKNSVYNAKPQRQIVVSYIWTSFLKFVATLGFSSVSWVRLQTYKCPCIRHPDPKQQFVDHTKNCGNRTRYKLHDSQLPSHRVKHAVKA
ncbi:hypothetical protein SFRURICE_007919, partial [Spodoptera frugiperda]